MTLLDSQAKNVYTSSHLTSLDGAENCAMQFLWRPEGGERTMEFLGIPTSTWQEIGLALLILAGAAILARLALLLIDRLFKRLARRTPTSFDDALLDAVRVPLFWAIMFFALTIALDQLTFLPADWSEGRENLRFVLYWLVAWLFVHKLVSNMMNWYSREMARVTESSLDESMIPFLRRVAVFLVGAIAVIVLLSHFGIDVSALVTSLGIASLAIALAARNTLSDWITGFVIILDRPFKIGDRIEIQSLNTWGDVQDIGLQNTRVLTRDNRMVVVPNSVIGKNLVVNHSDPSTQYRVQTHVGVDYGTDVAHARQVMVDAVRAQDWVMHDERIEALFIEFGDVGIIFRVRCWIEHYVETRRIMDKLNSCLYDALNEAGIEMPMPVQTLYHRVESGERDGLMAVVREEPREE
jgi:small-conductance mechanosensitive channel